MSNDLEVRARASTIRQADELVRAIETRRNLLQYEMGGWCVWPIFRVETEIRLLGKVPPPGGAGRRVQVRERLGRVLADVRSIAMAPPATYCVIGYASNRSERRQGRAVDIFFDPLLSTLGDFFKIEHLDNRAFLSAADDAWTPADASSTLLNMLAAVAAQGPVPRRTRQVAAELSSALRSEVGFDIFPVAEVERRILRFARASRIYEAVFDRLNPRFLLLVAAYGEHAAVAAAKRRGITVVEFQHGLIDDAAYSWTEYATPFRSRMPVPDRIFVYGEHWREQLRRRGFWKEEPRVVGSLRIDHHRSLASEHAEGCTLVITTQGLEQERLARFVGETLTLAEDWQDLRVVLKLHHAESDISVYQNVLGRDQRVQLVPNSAEPSTFDLLRRASFHLSISSTCHYEAVGLGTPTVVLELPGSEMVSDLVERGFAYSAKSPHDVLHILRSAGSRTIDETARGRLFAPNALENIIRELRP